MVEPGRVRANGIDFAYLGAGEGPLVLLLHGFPDTAHTWDRVIREVAATGHRVVAPFMRGYHPTQIAGPYDIDTLGRDALALIEALGETAATIVGHDWGAAAAYAAAALGPERVTRLITLAIPHPRAIPRSPRQVWGLRHFLYLRRNVGAALRAGDLRYIDELWRRWSPTWTDIPASETSAAKEAFAHPGSLEAACAYYAAIPLLPRPPPSAFMPIKAPTSVFAGTADHMMRRRIFEKAQAYFDGSYEIVDVPGGHFMHREHPDEVVPKLVAAITRSA